MDVHHTLTNATNVFQDGVENLFERLAFLVTKLTANASIGLSLRTALLSTVGGIILAHVIPYLYDPYSLRNYPGPWLAKFSDIWLAVVSKGGHRSEVVHRMHQKYGPIIRIAPNHISISSPPTTALHTIYGHGNGALKSNFYDAFVSIQRGLFNTRDRAQHTRKRKIVSHVFAPKNVLEFEPNVRGYVGMLLDRWDGFWESQVGKGDEGEGWVRRDGRVWFDVLPWANYLAFDIIGDLAFGAPFGMIAAGKDSAPVPVSQAEALASYASSQSASEKGPNEFATRSLPAISILNGRGEFSMSLGAMPPWWRPLARRTPWFSKGSKDVKALAGIAIAAVGKRLREERVVGREEGRNDLLSKLQKGKDENGNPMGTEELTAEALTLLIAGSDTTSNSTCAILYYLALYPSTQAKLQSELDARITEPTASYQDVTSGSAGGGIPYLDNCINEALRLHSTSSLGLPRIVPDEGMTIEGVDEFFKAGTVLSVPSYTIHRDVGVWGEDVEVFRPERWEEGGEEGRRVREGCFNPFSYGPRACVGRNLAMLELQIIIASLVRRYHFVLEDPDEPLRTREGFLRKPLGCRVGIMKRDVIV